MLVLGEREAADGTVSVREHGGADRGAIAIDAFAAELAELARAHAR
jgi:threonyl-tRNA synthetase